MADGWQDDVVVHAWLMAGGTGMCGMVLGGNGRGEGITVGWQDVCVCVCVCLCV